MRTVDFDVAVVGAGVVGCAIAARLSAGQLDVCVLDRRHDVCEETSKATSAITDSGWESDPTTLEARLIKASNPRWEEISEQLGVPFRRTGVLLVARSEDDSQGLGHALHEADVNGVEARTLDPAATLAEAPYVAADVRGAVEIAADGVVDPLRLTHGWAELAARNGVRFAFGAPVVGARVDSDLVIELHTPSLIIRPRFVVNAAGLGADVVSRAMGAEDFRVWPRRGEYLVVDAEFGRTVDRIVARPPSDIGGGVMVIPTPAGRLLLGPTAEESEDKEDVSTHSEVLAGVFEACRELVPGLRRDHVLTSFCGLRAASDRTYRIERSADRSNLIQACGIRSTGIASSPAVADLVRELLIDAGLRWVPRPAAIRELSCPDADGQEESEIVCACERVSAASVRAALTARIPARSVAGVARRTQATRGACQGADCLGPIVNLVAAADGSEVWTARLGEPGSIVGVAAAPRLSDK